MIAALGKLEVPPGVRLVVVFENVSGVGTPSRSYTGNNVTPEQAAELLRWAAGTLATDAQPPFASPSGVKPS